MPSSKVARILNESNAGIVGIDEDGSVHGGYDNSWPEAGIDPDMEYFDEGEPLSVAEKVELADIMIERWQAYKNRAQQRG